jgi:hypothetical protein
VWDLGAASLWKLSDDGQGPLATVASGPTLTGLIAGTEDQAVAATWNRLVRLRDQGDGGLADAGSFDLGAGGNPVAVAYDADSGVALVATDRLRWARFDLSASGPPDAGVWEPGTVAYQGGQGAWLAIPGWRFLPANPRSSSPSFSPPELWSPFFPPEEDAPRGDAPVLYPSRHVPQFEQDRTRALVPLIVDGEIELHHVVAPEGTIVYSVNRGVVHARGSQSYLLDLTGPR